MRILAVAACFLFVSSASAENINYNALDQEGYGNVAELLKSMTPEQRAEVMKQAAIREKELKAMPPEDVNVLKTQLHNVNDTLYVEKIDPAKLDTSKIKSTKASMKDLNSYQKQYAQGKIKNSAVKPRGSVQ